MTIIKIAPNENGSHANQTINGVTPATFPVPEGWAVIPEDLETPNFPFGEVEVEEQMYHLEDPTPPDEGEAEVEPVPPLAMPVMVVTSWTPLPMPESAPLPEPGPTQLDRIEAQVTWTALQTDTLLEEV